MKRVQLCLSFILFSSVIVHAQVTRKEMITPDGTVEHIFYSEGKEIAKQKLDTNGTILQTIGNVPDGVVKGYYESGIVEYECLYKDNKIEGVVKVYYKSGKLQQEWNYKNNKRNGITNWYNEHGTLMRQFNYKNGKLDGISKKFYENGALWSTKTYKDGKFIARKEYDTNGKLQSEWNYPGEKQEVK